MKRGPVIVLFGRSMVWRFGVDIDDGSKDVVGALFLLGVDVVEEILM